MRLALENLRFAVRQVFARASYVAIAVILAVAAFLVAMWLPNFRLIGEVFGSSSAPLAAKFGVAFSLLGGIATNFSPLSAGYTIAISVLFGATTAMIAYLLRQKHAAEARESIAIGSSGLASGVVGIGCAACGSLILGGLVSSAGVTGALALLPLDGAEFGILSVALLVVSLFLVSRNIARSGACPLPERPGILELKKENP